MPELSRFSELREAYEAAFRELAHRVRAWRSLADRRDASTEEVETLRLRVAEALERYRQSRDRLAALMLSDRGQDGKDQTRALAAVSGASVAG